MNDNQGKTARERAVAFLAASTDAQLATAFTKAITDDPKRELSPIEPLIRAEARRRVGAEAARAGDAERDAWGKRNGWRDDLTDDEADALFTRAEGDGDPFPPGEWFFMVEALYARGKG